MRILVTGAGGLLGQAICREAVVRGYEVLGLSRDLADVTDFQAVLGTFRGFSPQVVFNCAAFSAVDRAESDPAGALAVNRDGAGNVARAAAESHALVVHMSTDYVFDGRSSIPYLPDDPPSPLNVYGISKLAGEMAVREATPDSLIVRTSWLFGAGGSGFVSLMKRKLSETGEPVRVVADEVSRPTFVEDLAPALLDLAKTEERGCMHLGGGGSCSRLELAEEIRRVSGGTREIVGVSAEAFGAPARRPRYSVLDLTFAVDILGSSLPFWADSLERYLQKEDG